MIRLFLHYNERICFFWQKNCKKYLDPLVGVRHHGNEEVDQDDGGDQHVKGKDYLEEIHQAGRVVRGHVELMVAEREREYYFGLWSSLVGQKTVQLSWTIE